MLSHIPFPRTEILLEAGAGLGGIAGAHVPGELATQSAPCLHTGPSLPNTRLLCFQARELVYSKDTYQENWLSKTELRRTLATNFPCGFSCMRCDIVQKP